MKPAILILLVLVSFKLRAQSEGERILSWSGYLEAYYGFDSGKPENNTRPDFVYTYTRHNQVALNLGLIRVLLNKSNLRANLGLMTGSYANSNLAAEPGVLKNIYEANAGIKLTKNKSLWLDAGIFSSHIGFESAIGKDCLNLTRSILADNSPYYESGVKLSYTTDNEKWFISGLVLNGWQQIQRIDGNSMPAFGHQLTVKAGNKITLNSSSFIGSDAPDSVRVMRYFHNFYCLLQLHQKAGIIAGFDIGVQQQSKGSNSYFTWYAPVLIVRYGPADLLTIAARGEFYSDENHVIVTTGVPDPFKVSNFSLNLDFNFSKNIIWRIEARTYQSKYEIFTADDSAIDQNYLFITALAVTLNE